MKKFENRLDNKFYFPQNIVVHFQYVPADEAAKPLP